MFATLLGVAVAKLEDNPHWQAREKIIQEHNSKSHTWTAGHNVRFLGQPLGAMKPLLGAILREKGSIPKDEVLLNNNITVPESFDSATNWPECADVINDIRDQSNCGCCWAFGGAEAASDRLCIYSKGGIKVPLSANEMCFCAESDGCDGGMLATAWDFIKRKGLVTGGQYNNTGPLGGGYCSAYPLPHCHHHGPQGDDPYPAEGQPGCPSESSPACPSSCDTDAESPHNDWTDDKYGFSGRVVSLDDEALIQKSISQYGPIETAFSVYSDFENYVSGVYQKTAGSEFMGGHAVKIVGWGEDNGTKYWKVANSWNPYWGEKGYFRILRGTDECGIESQGMASSATATWKKM